MSLLKFKSLADARAAKPMTGFYKNSPGTVPLANLWLTVLRAFGGPQSRFADSTGLLADVLA